MSNAPQLFSTPRQGNDEWETPDWLFDKLDRVFSFELDVCATPENAKCERFISPEDDALGKKWAGRCWMNPPYSREIGSWIQKAYESAKQGDALVVCLLPAKTDTAWWQRWVQPHGLIHFIEGRLKFKGARYNAPFPSALVLFLPKP